MYIYILYVVFYNYSIINKYQRQLHDLFHKVLMSIILLVLILPPLKYLYLKLSYLQTLNFILKNNLWDVSTINTICFDRNDEMTTLLQKVLGINSYNTCLIGLSDIGKNNIDHTNL